VTGALVASTEGAASSSVKAIAPMARAIESNTAEYFAKVVPERLRRLPADAAKFAPSSASSSLLRHSLESSAAASAAD